MQTKTVFTSGLDGRLVYFRYNATSGCVDDNVIETGNIENMEVGVGISFLAVLCAVISISGIARLPVISRTTAAFLVFIMMITVMILHCE